jgi:hypothetical protein
MTTKPSIPKKSVKIGENWWTNPFLLSTNCTNHLIKTDHADHGDQSSICQRYIKAYNAMNRGKGKSNKSAQSNLSAFHK